MENIKIRGYHDIFFIPTINFDKDTGICEISGESYIENTSKFYQPLIDWIEQFIRTQNKLLVLNIKLIYFNTGTSKSIFNILNLIKKHQDAGASIQINWYYYENDSDMLEAIDDYEAVTAVKINKFLLE